MAKDNYHILYESHIEDNKKAKNALSAAKAVESKIKKKYVAKQDKINYVYQEKWNI